MVEETREGIQLPIVWVGGEEELVALVNQFLGQVGHQGEIVLTFGQVTAPPLVGTREQQEEQARQIPHVSTKTVARVALTRAGLEELIGVLRHTLDNHEQAQEMMARRAKGDDETSQSALSSFDVLPSLKVLAEEQGVSPITDLDELIGDFWPEDESIDDFIATVRRWRREGDTLGS